jgi:hypothetical protein
MHLLIVLVQEIVFAYISKPYAQKIRQMSQPFPSVTLESGHIDRVSIPTLTSSANRTRLHIDTLRPCLQRYPLERTRAKPEPHLKKSLQPCRWESSSPTLVSARTVYQPWTARSLTALSAHVSLSSRWYTVRAHCIPTR